MREHRGLTKEELAERLGLSRDQIAGLESGEIHSRHSLRLILMRYFDCQFEELFEVSGVQLEGEDEKATN
jgi:DNA-binding XRE family transcriptional regulator